MTMSEITSKLLAAKKEKGLSFADLEEKLGFDEVWIASVFYRQASASAEEASKMVELIGLGPEYAEALT
ncbi:MAG: cyanate hydratase, partial [Cyanobacteria bacterium J06598_1]